MTRLISAVLALLFVVTPALTQPDDDLESFLQQTLGAARDKAHIPGLAALIQIDGRIAAEAAIGVRALGHPEAVSIDDRWHLGSDTKAFTSTMIARLVEERVMSWDDTLAASFPSFAKQINPAYRNITVTQLLSHTAGAPPLTDAKELSEFFAVLKTAHGVKAQRAAIARKYLSMAPASKAGEFKYSNLGYIIAGAIAESRTGKAWEELIREQIFAPLRISSGSFGVPGTAGKFDQPRGHTEMDGNLTPLDPADPESDNPPALGPAGTINISLKDWMRFAQDQLDGLHGHGKLLQAETYKKLHTPVTATYALGWGVKIESDGSTSQLTHTGSNGYWLAQVSIMSKRDVITLIAMNSGNEAANDALRDMGKSLGNRLKPFD